VIMEMKIDAADGDSQLARYAEFGKSRRKEYVIYYLTLDGHKPDEQSAAGVPENKLRYASFEKEIITWLEECIKFVDEGGYKYSFLKQYLGAVRHITGINDEVINVKDLLNNSDMLKAARLVADSLEEKLDDIQAEFFQKLDAIIRRRSKLETDLYTSGVDVYLEEFTFRKHSYCVTLSIFFDPSLYVSVRFQKIDDEYIALTLDAAEQTFPSIYRAWMKKLDSLQGVPKFRNATRSKWFYLENSRGEQLNFKDKTAQVELMDEMDQQCKYIGDYIVKLIIKPLLGT